MPAETDKVILLVEDEPNDEALILRAFRTNNVHNRIVVARDGVEALEYLQGGAEPAEVPVVVLLDLKLPRIDGLEVLRRIRQDERLKLVPVVILTSSDEERDRLGSYRLGANSYVRKPIDFGEFVEAVRQMGLYWLILNVPPPMDR